MVFSSGVQNNVPWQSLSALKGTLQRALRAVLRVSIQTKSGYSNLAKSAWHLCIRTGRQVMVESISCLAPDATIGALHCHKRASYAMVFHLAMLAVLRATNIDAANCYS